VSTDIAQNYPSGSETEAEREAVVERTLATFDGLREKVRAEATPLDGPSESGRRWVWVCTAQAPDFSGRLHVAGYARDRHALYVVCDTCGRTFLR
jgi:hypothetical protein